MTAPSPYRGPRPLEKADGVYGRDAELAELESLLLSQRIVLLYSASGHGKTSLLRAGLLPRLEGKFDITYVAGFAVAATEEAPSGNRYEEHIHAALAETDRVSSSHSPERGTRMRLLVLDQFEELFTIRTTDWRDKRAFLTWLGEFLRDPTIWAVLALREEYLAVLKPYRRLFPRALATELRIEALQRDAAVEAMIRPAAAEPYGVVFDPNLAVGLADVLSDVRTRDEEGNDIVVAGEFVEPMHLQLTCQKLWNGWRSKDEHGKRLTVTVAAELDLLEGVEDVVDTLAEYYDQTVRSVATDGSTRERDLREWFDSRLMTQGGHRIPAEPLSDDAEGRRVVNALIEAYLIRRSHGGEERNLVELSHDLLTEAVLSSNGTAYDALEPLYSAARRWRESGSNPSELASRAQWDAIARVYRDQGDMVSPDEVAFVEQSARALKRRFWTVVLGILAALLAIGIVAVVQQWRESDELRRIASERLASAMLDAGTRREQALSRSVAAAEELMSSDSLSPEFRSALHWMVAQMPTRDVLRIPGDGSVYRATHIASSPGTDLVFTANTDRGIETWAVTGTALTRQGVLPDSTGLEVMDLVAAYDGSKVVAIAADGTAEVWVWRQSHYVHHDAVIQDVTDVAMTPSGSLAVIGSDQIVVDWNDQGLDTARAVTASEQYVVGIPPPNEGADDPSAPNIGAWVTGPGTDFEVEILTRGVTTAIDSSHDGGYVAIGTASGEIGLVEMDAIQAIPNDAADSHILFEAFQAAHGSSVHQVSFLDEDGFWLLSLAESGDIAVWRRSEATLELARAVDFRSRRPMELAALRWPSEVIVLTESGSVERWDISVGHDRAITALASYDGERYPRILSGGLDGLILQWETNKSLAIPLDTHRPDPPVAVVDIVELPDRSGVVAAWADGFLQRIPCPDEDIGCQTAIPTASVASVAVLDNGSVIAADDEGGLWTWNDGAKPQAVRIALGVDAHVAHMVAVKPKQGPDEIVVVMMSDGTSRGIDPQRWISVGALEGRYSSTAYGIARSTGLLYTTSDGTVYADELELSDGAATSRRGVDSAFDAGARLGVHSSEVVHIASGDELSATVGSDGSMRLWKPTHSGRPTAGDEPQKWALFAELDPASPAIESIFVTDASGVERLVVGGADGRIQLFEISDERQIAAVRRIDTWTPSAIQCQLEEINWMPACRAIAETHIDAGIHESVRAAFHMYQSYQSAINEGDWPELRRLVPQLADAEDDSLEDQFSGRTWNSYLVAGSVEPTDVVMRVLEIVTDADGYEDAWCYDLKLRVDADDLGTLEQMRGARITTPQPGDEIPREAAQEECAVAELASQDS